MRVCVEHQDRYTAVRVSGSPTIGQFIAFVERLGVECVSWPHRRGLFDLRGIDTLRTVTDHVAIGKAVVDYLSHLERLASVVDPDRITGISRKVARESGVELSVFTEEAEAAAWLASE